MRFINAKFIKSASKKDEFIHDLPEVAIVGRSNVGKSSLINMLTNNGKLAKTSSTPGRTRLVNYFNIDNKFYLVDLPGYGFHKASKGIASSWDSVMNDYFSYNPNLKLVLLLLDCRVMLTDLDRQMIDYLFELQVPALIVLTKTDKITRSEINLKIAHLSNELRYNKDQIVATSASKKIGVDKIGSKLDEYINS